MNHISALAALTSSLIVSWMLLPLMRTLAFRLGAVDHPGARRVHREVTPRLGGLAIFAGVCAGISVGAMVAVRQGGAAGLEWCDGLFSVVVAVGACFMILGFVDDVRGLSAGLKLGIEVLLALVLFGAGGQIHAIDLPGIGMVTLSWPLSLLCTVLWITAVTNAFNMIDGVNGLAGGVGLITSIGVAVIALASGAPGALLLAAVLAGSMISFLRANLRPGGIFLGDSGSLYVGFMLSAATLLMARPTGHSIFPGIGLLLMGLPLVEVATTVLRRTMASRTWYRGLGGAWRFLRSELMCPDAGHLHHILIRGGLPAGSTAILLIGAAFFYALCSVAMFMAPEHARAFLAGGGVMSIACCVLSLRASLGRRGRLVGAGVGIESSWVAADAVQTGVTSLDDLTLRTTPSSLHADAVTMIEGTAEGVEEGKIVPFPAADRSRPVSEPAAEAATDTERLAA